MVAPFSLYLIGGVIAAIFVYNGIEDLLTATGDAYGEESDGFGFTDFLEIGKGAKLIMIGPDAMDENKVVKIPCEYKGKPVTSLAKDGILAMSPVVRDEAETIIIPATVEIVCANMFKNFKSLKTVIFEG